MEAIRDHVQDKYKTTCRNLQGVSELLTPFRGDFQQQTVFVEEPGMYELVFSSKLPSALKFRDWVFEEVLPSIRETGTYTLPCALRTIKSITCDDLTALDDDERKEYKQILKIQHDMIKDERKVEMGRRGGLKTQKDIREIKSRCEELEVLVSEIKDLILL